MPDRSFSHEHVGYGGGEGIRGNRRCGLCPLAHLGDATTADSHTVCYSCAPMEAANAVREGMAVSKFNWGDLYGGGTFRWLIRGVVLGSLALLLILYRLLHINIFVAILISSTVFIVGLTVTYVLFITGRIKIKL